MKLKLKLLDKKNETNIIKIEEEEKKEAKGSN